MRIAARILLAIVGVGVAELSLSGSSQAAPDEKKPPFFASIAAGKARMRTGPARSYPSTWLYRRVGLPVKVIDVYQGGQWYKVEDPAGTQGWMLRALISDVRTGIVLGGIAALRDSPGEDGRVLWRAAPGVVGRLSKCARGWCYFEVRGRGGGYVESVRLWGVEPGEDLG